MLRLRVLKRLTSRQSSEAGFSLPELIVAMSLLAIALTMIITLFTSFNTTFSRERAATDSTNVAAIGMNEVTKVVRAGTTLTKADRPVFVKAESEELILYSYLADTSIAPKPIMVRFGIDAERQLIEQRWTATTNAQGGWAFPSLVLTPPPSKIAVTPATSRVVARMIIAPTPAEVAAGQSHLFTYLDANGAEIASPVASTDLGNITTVRITMTVQADVTARAEPVTIQNRVALPNLNASRLGLVG